jgi:hypothetical protein
MFLKKEVFDLILLKIELFLNLKKKFLFTKKKKKKKKKIV